MEILVSIWENTAYVFSVALQLAAAFLLVGNIAIKKEKIIEEFISKHSAIVFEGEQLLDYSSLHATVKSNWINRFAFTYLYVGYLLMVLGNCSISKLKAVVIIVCLFLVLYIIPEKVAKQKCAEYQQITTSDIPMKDGVLVLSVSSHQE